MSANLRRLYQGFKANLERIRDAATKDEAIAALAAEGLQNGCPPKQAIYGALACCRPLMVELFGQARWRCPRIVHKSNTLSTTELLASHFDPGQCREVDKSRLREFVWDFSFSNHSLLDAANEEFDWPLEDRFNLLLVAESEVQGSNKKRIAFIIRDLIKLCLPTSPFRVLIYHAYKQQAKNDKLIAAIKRTISRCCGGDGKIALGEWLVIGLRGKWPHSQTVCGHIFENKANGGGVSLARQEW